MRRTLRLLKYKLHIVTLGLYYSQGGSMLIVQVFIHVKSESVEAFKAASMENAAQSILEPGCARFDVIQQLDDPNRFVLYEAYRTQADNDFHKQTAHYLKWREAVADMQAEDRSSIKYTGCFPPDDAWK